MDWRFVHGQTVDLYEILCSAHCIAVSTTGNINKLGVESLEQQLDMMRGKSKHDVAWLADRALYME